MMKVTHKQFLDACSENNVVCRLTKNGKMEYVVEGELTAFNVVKRVLGKPFADYVDTDLAEYFKREQDKKKKKALEDGYCEIQHVALPPRESRDCFDINAFDEQVWKDVKFVENEPSLFYVRDSEGLNTYTSYLTCSNASEGSDARTLREAFYKHKTDVPELAVKRIIQNFPFNPDTFDDDMYNLPVTAWKYIKVKTRSRKGRNGDSMSIQEKLVVDPSTSQKLYEGFFAMESEFRRMGTHTIKHLKTLTNDPAEAAIAFIDLKALQEQFGDDGSELWDTFLLQRLHSEAYVSIVKAWLYAVAVGKNNSRQELWLYGNGGTGKSVMCKALITGFNELAHKDICLAASKDSGKSNFNSELLNKHFMVYSDAKNLKQGMSEAKHNITGGDYMRIEGKGKDAISAKVYMKCLSCSNERPQCDMTDRSQTSRYIVLPFTLSDDEMKQYGLMRRDGSIIGSATFEDELVSEFPKFLASCKKHYEQRCENDSNIYAYEAHEELESINLTAALNLEDFVQTFFDITDDAKTDRVTQKEFRAHFIRCAESCDESGVKLWSEIRFDDVRSYLEKKYGFQWKNCHVNGTTMRCVSSAAYGLKLHEADMTTAEASTDSEIDSMF